LSTEHFDVICFAFDGELLGQERQALSDLSAKWLSVCGDFLASYAPVFDASLGGPLDHIRFKWTASDGTALVTVSTHGMITSSFALASGVSPGTERKVLTMFVESLRNTDIVKQVANSSEPFAEILTTSDRPLLCIVIWNANVTEQDGDLVRELTMHLAGAYFASGPTVQ
jgi:hypothetical protein